MKLLEGETGVLFCDISTREILGLGEFDLRQKGATGRDAECCKAKNPVQYEIFARETIRGRVDTNIKAQGAWILLLFPWLDSRRRLVHELDRLNKDN